MPKLNARDVAYTFLNVCAKMHQFLSSIKKTHTEEKWFFFLPHGVEYSGKLLPCTHAYERKLTCAPYHLQVSVTDLFEDICCYLEPHHQHFVLLPEDNSSVDDFRARFESISAGKTETLTRSLDPYKISAVYLKPVCP